MYAIREGLRSAGMLAVLAVVQTARVALFGVAFVVVGLGWPLLVAVLVTVVVFKK